jgi:hypothetical protein
MPEARAFVAPADPDTLIDAAVRLGARFGLPVVITARGSDTSQLPDHAVPRRLILDGEAARRPP